MNARQRQDFTRRSGHSKKNLFTDQAGEIMHRAYQLAHIAHFIVIPADGSDQLFVAHGHYFGLGSIEERTKMAANDVTAHDFFFGISKTFIACCLHGCIYFICGHFFIEDRGQFGERTGNYRYALCTAVQLTLQFG